MSEKKMMTASEMGKRGGRARARKLTADERSAISRLGGLAGGRGRKKKKKTA
jgi:hypothetical protein